MCSMFNKSKDINSVQNWNGKFSYQCLCFSLPPAIPGDKWILHYFPSTDWLFCDMAAGFSQSKWEVWESETGAEVPPCDFALEVTPRPFYCTQFRCALIQCGRGLQKSKILRQHGSLGTLADWLWQNVTEKWESKPGKKENRTPRKQRIQCSKVTQKSQEGTE